MSLPLIPRYTPRPSHLLAHLRWPSPSFIPGHLPLLKLRARRQPFTSSTQTVSYRHLGMMFLHMLTWGTTKLQVLYSVISRIVVYMMHNLLSREIPTNMFLHNQTMFCNIPLFSTKRMTINLDVPIKTTFNTPPFPTRRFIHFPKLWRLNSSIYRNLSQLRPMFFRPYINPRWHRRLINL